MKDIFDNILSGNAGDVSIIPVMNLDASQPLGEAEMPETLPILTLRNAILFPETVIPITVGREKSIRLVNEVYKSNKLLGAVAQIDVKTEDPGPDDIYEIGTLGRIVKIIEMPDNSVMFLPLILSNIISMASITSPALIILAIVPSSIPSVCSIRLWLFCIAISNFDSAVPTTSGIN